MESDGKHRDNRHNEAAAIYLGRHKMGYRATKNGIRGMAFVKGEELEFEDLSSLIPKMCNGPHMEIE